jgi:hypothetical protein
LSVKAFIGFPCPKNAAGISLLAIRRHPPHATRRRHPGRSVGP